MISKFEKNNKKHDIRINVYGWNTLIDKKRSYLVPIQISKTEAKNTINLLLIKDHFYYIKNFNRLLGAWNSNYHHFCENCLIGFKSHLILEKHKQRCYFFKPTLTLFPKGDKKFLYFKNFRQMVEYPFVIYSDFECILKKIKVKKSNKIIAYQKHIPCGYCLIAVSNENEVMYKNFYRGSDSAKVFLEDIKIQTEILLMKMLKYKEMEPLTKLEELEFSNAKICYLCNQPFKSDIKSIFIPVNVHYHDHFTGKYRGAAHNNCNINYKLPKTIPVFFHNLKGYDAHIIIDALTNYDFKEVELIPQSYEKYISFTLDNTKFLDSFQFMPGSLDKLVNNLKNSNYDFPITKNIFSSRKNLSSQSFNLLLQKQIYPYDYINSFKKFDEEKLPNKKYFYLALNYNNISDEEYQHACKIWDIFNIQTLGEYHDLYVLLDTCLLADLFQAFRKTILSRYELDPYNFYSAPGLAWAAALKKTNVKLELITDIDMYQFIENGIRGGICQVSKRFCRANNKYMDNFNPKNESKYIVYLDGKMDK